MKFIYNDQKVYLYQKEVEVAYLVYEKKHQEIHISYIYTYPGYRNNGYAKILMNYCIDLFEKLNCRYSSSCWYINRLQT